MASMTAYLLAGPGAGPHPYAMNTLIPALELAAAIFAVIALVRGYRKALREHPPLDYEPAQVSWRWSTPPEGLVAQQAEAVSVLVVPRPKRTGALIAELAAYGLGVFMIAMTIASWLNGQTPLVQLVPLFIVGPLIPVCLRMATRLDRIELRPDTVTFIERGDLWWHRRRTRRRPLRAAGKMESMFSVDRGQDPEHEIVLRGGLLGTRMRSACNQSTGSWIVGGLNAWSAAKVDQDAA